MKFGFDWPSGFRTEDISILWKFTCTVCSSGAGADNPQGGGGGAQNFSININLLSICLFPVSFTY